VLLHHFFVGLDFVVVALRLLFDFVMSLAGFVNSQILTVVVESALKRK
jgi:hypothetical protein